MRRLSAVVQLFHLLANPLVIILLVASAIAGSLGQQVDALIIVTMVALVAISALLLAPASAAQAQVSFGITIQAGQSA